MNDHELLNGYLPEYAVGGLDADLRHSIKEHLQTCQICKEDLILWQLISESAVDANQNIRPISDLTGKAMSHIHNQKHKPEKLQMGWLLLKSQLPLVRREIWPASIAIMIIGYIAAVLVGKEVVIQVLAPLVAAASIGMIFGSENDPVTELMFSVPTSPRQVLLARLSIVFSFNFLLALAASLCLLPALPNLVLWPMILGWLGPMAFLSALALFLSVYFGSENAIVAAYGTWILKYIILGAFSIELIPQESVLSILFNGYTHLWQQPAALFIAAGVFLLGALWSTEKVEYRSFHLAG